MAGVASTDVTSLRCIECHRVSASGHEWRAYLTSDPDDPSDEPEVSVYCAECAEREFGRLPRRARRSA